MIRARAKLTRSGQILMLAAIACGVVALLLDYLAPAIASALWISMFAVSWFVPAWSLRGLHELRLVPCRILESEERVVELALATSGRLALLGVRLRARERELALDGEIPVCRPGPALPHLVRIRGGHRGQLQSLRLRCETDSPFGLLRHHRHVQISVDVWVLPRAHAIREHVLEEMLQLRPRGWELPQPSGPGDGEFYALREFRPGDAEQRVHPRLSARRGIKVLRVFRGEAPPLVRIVLDRHVPLTQATFQGADFEEALRFAAGIVRALLQRSIPVELYSVGDEGVECLVERRSRDPYAFLSALALCQPLAGPAAYRLPRWPREPGRKVLIHLGPLEGAARGAEWIAIQAGSQAYYQLLEPRFQRLSALEPFG